MDSKLFSNFLVRLIIAVRHLLGTNEVHKFPGYPAKARSTITFPQQAAIFGYRAEEHQVITEDGYILTMFRIPRGANCHGVIKGPPVLFMHGVLESADTFIDAGPKDGLGYLVADECYDTWFGNVRGTFYSRQHVYLNPDRDWLFWQFTVDEIGLYDVPASINHVLKVTGAQQLNYIGFSQGGGTFIIMCSERPGYCEKVRLFIGLSPSTRHYHTKSIPFRVISTTINKLRRPLDEVGIWEIFTKGYPVQAIIRFFCQNRLLAGAVCGTLISVLDSSHPGSITPETLKIGFSHAPAGISTKNAAKYGQAVMSKKFVKFDYGLRKNLEIYGKPYPPEYNFSAVTVPVVVIQGLNDGIVDIKDSFWAAAQLPKLISYRIVRDRYWTHFDQTYSMLVSEATFPIIKKYLSQYSNYFL